MPALLITKHRTVFLNKHFYIALIVALIIVSPNLIWQYNNDFPVFHHLKELTETQLVNVSRFDFLKEQLLFFLGALFVLILAFISFFRYAPFRKYQIFFWSYIFTIAIFTFLKAKGYYAIGLYPILLAFGSVYLEKLLAKGWVRYLRPIVILIPVVIMMPILEFILPVLSPEKIVARGIAHVPERRRVFPYMSVFDNLKAGAYLRKDSEIGPDLENVFHHFSVDSSSVIFQKK